jgi:CubicO group peptidase (beta-lactamase class C family)
MLWSYIIISIVILCLVVLCKKIQSTNEKDREKRKIKLTLADWQTKRDQGLKQFEKIARDLIVVNAEHVRKLNDKCDKSYQDLPSIKKILMHKDLDSMIILKDNNIVFEHYANGMNKDSLHSCQSTTKTILNLLIGNSFTSGKLLMDDLVEDYLPTIGSGFRGRTIKDVLSMNVKHELDEIAAYTNSSDIFKKDEASSGFLPSKIYPYGRYSLLTEIKAGNENNTNINKTGKYFYASVNTDVGGWIVEKAEDIPLHILVKKILHGIGGENPIYMVTDKIGFPIIMGGMVMTARDFARYGLLLMSGGKSITGEMLGGGPDFVRQTMNEGTITLGKPGWHYNNSTYTSEYGLGHAGWGGQWLWVDPQSKTVIIIFSGLSGNNPTDPTYSDQLFNITKEVISKNRGK